VQKADSAQAGRLLPFVALQGALSTVVGFGAWLVYGQGGGTATVQYALVLLTAAVLAISLPYALGRWLQLAVATWVRLCFAVPALLLWWADGRPLLLAVALGGFLGAGWAARHWLELSLLQDGQRDAYAARATVWTVLASLATTLAVSVALARSGEAAQAAYACYAVLAALAVVLAPRQLPQAAPLRLQNPLAIVRHAAFVRSLPLYFLESGLMGVGLVINASAAVHALGLASHYGWALSAATVLGAAGLHAVRARRHAGNRLRWMGLACLGMVLAQALLAATAWQGWLYVPHLLLLAWAQPFWQASEQVLNQRALDLEGALADRILVREWVLWLFRVGSLLLFWLAARNWPAPQQWFLGSLLMGLATLAEWRLARHWLRHRP